LTEDEFAAASRVLAMRKRPLAMAYEVLVNGKRQVDVAREYQVSRNAVSLAVKNLKSAHHVPEGFERVTVVIPKSKIPIVQQWQYITDNETDSLK
jgi:hypothetical protein